jgi:hypothetical protein
MAVLVGGVHQAEVRWEVAKGVAKGKLDILEQWWMGRI